MNGLRTRRIAMHLTQDDIASVMGVDRASVSRWENGDAFPKTSRLRDLAILLHCTVDELLEDQRGN